MDQVLNLSKKFWRGLEAADVETMRSVCDPLCYFVHIGGNCDLDKEMSAFSEKIFQPTEVVLNKQDVKDFGDTAIVISDVDYGLLLDGKRIARAPSRQKAHPSPSSTSSTALERSV